MGFIAHIFALCAGYAETSGPERACKPGSVARPKTGSRPSIWDDGCPPPQAAYPGTLDGPPSSIPLFGLAPGGVYQASPVTRAAGALLPHRFTLTPIQTGRFVFCGTFPRVTPGGRYPPPCPAEPGLSSRRRCCARPRSPLRSMYHAIAPATGAMASGLLIWRRAGCASSWNPPAVEGLVGGGVGGRVFAAPHMAHLNGGEFAGCLPRPLIQGFEGLVPHAILAAPLTGHEF